MDVAVFCRRLSDNTFVRSYHLLGTLSDANVTVYGMVDNRGIHPFFDQDRFDFRALSTATYGEWDGESLNLARGKHLFRQGVDAVRLWREFNRRSESTDIIFIASGWKGSVGAGLLAKYVSRSNAPLVVDVYDHTDWVEQVPLVNPLEYTDSIITSNRPLANLLGGTSIPTPVDTDKFDPDGYDRTAIRTELGYEEEDSVVGFIGTPREEKGLDALIEAVEDGPESIRGLIVGAGDDTYSRELRQASGERMSFIEPVPHSEVPRYYAALDALVLAQQQTPYCKYQIPAKLFEAMSMRTPVIATEIGDIPFVLDDAGILIEESSSIALLEAFERLEKADAEKMGRRGRERALTVFSSGVIGQQLKQMFTELVAEGT